MNPNEGQRSTLRWVREPRRRPVAAVTGAPPGAAATIPVMPTNDDPASPEKSEETAETLDILGDPVLTAKIRAGMDDIAAGRVEVLSRDKRLRSLKG